MGAEQFAQTMRGTNGILRTNASGVVETDNYPHGDGVSASGADYPVSINPAETIQEINVTENTTNIDIELHTTGGDVFYAFQGGTVGTRDKYEVDKIVLSDPGGTGDTSSLDWAGE